jgi:TolB-like protein/AraC-like DNA-binding protein
MSENPVAKNEFITELHSIVEGNIGDEQFGVSELAEAMNMSRSNLLRKVKKETGLSVSQLISDVRLRRAMELLRTTSYNVSEVSHHVGFNSVSYFIKCFRELYGYPPGEVGKRDAERNADHPPEALSVTGAVDAPAARPFFNIKWAIAGFAAVAVIVITFYYLQIFSADRSRGEKSIAVLPFKNDSNDSSNVYLINGLMEATLNNLNQIKELKVISRTSAEKYRNTAKSIPEIGEELGVSYFVEGSGQKVGDRILLNIQLIDAVHDKHLWSKQYRRETKEIFALQEEISKDIAAEIEVIISPEEEKRIGRKPTENLAAYDYYLKGRDLFYKSGRMDLEASVPFFQKAVREDPKFALAYATGAMVFYYLDIFQVEKRHAHEVTNYAEQAMLHDPNAGESLVAKALDNANKREYAQAVRYFERALKLDPGNGLILHFLVEFYSIHIPNPRKHLEYALLKVKNDIPITDSATAGFNYFHLSSAFFETGFIDESITYINRSLAYDPNGYFSGYLKVYVQWAKLDDAEKAEREMLKEWKKDTARFDIMQEVGKMAFMRRDYREAYRYYRPLVDIRKSLQLDLFRYEDVRIAITFEKMGLKEESENLMRGFREFAENSKTMYKHLHLTMYYAAINNTAKALEHMKLFSHENDFHYAVLWINDDPIMDPIKGYPEFKAALKEIERKFWETHKEIDVSLRTEPLP